MAIAPPETHMPLTTRVPERLRYRLKVHCILTDTTLSAFLTEAVQELLAREAARAAKR